MWNMKTKLSNFFLLLATLIFSNSCDKPGCKNTNPIFDKFMFTTKEYKSELAKQIESIGTRNLSFWFNKYLKKSGEEFILINIQGEKLCAKSEIKVNDWSKISGMRKEINGYRGAELKGLKLEIEQDSTGTNLIYKNVDTIID